VESTTKAGLRYKPSAYGKAALEGEMERIETAPHGMRHSTVFAASCSVGALLAGGR
jgi:hypothetical protein